MENKAMNLDLDCSSTSYKVKNHHDNGNNQQDVDKTSANVAKKTKKP